MSYYILVDAELNDLPRKVHEQVIKGYVPIGGPTPSPEPRFVQRWLQAMYMAREPMMLSKGTLTTVSYPNDVFDKDGLRGERGLQLPTSQELDEAVREANEAHPGSASKGERFHMASNGEPFAFACVEDRAQWDSDNEEIRAFIRDGCEAFETLDEGKAEAVLNSAKRIFHRRITHLRQLQQTPYMKHRDPKTNADRFEMIEEHTRIGEGIMQELYAGMRARDPQRVESKPAVMIDLVDAQRIDSILESNRAQYPTEHQETVNRFKRAVHGTQES